VRFAVDIWLTKIVFGAVNASTVGPEIGTVHTFSENARKATTRQPATGPFVTTANNILAKNSIVLTIDTGETIELAQGRIWNILGNLESANILKSSMRSIAVLVVAV
jgi:hypothetical protein